MKKHFLFLNVKTISHPSGNNFSIFSSQIWYFVSAAEVVIDFTATKHGQPKNLHYKIELENMNKMPLPPEPQDQ